MWASKSKVYLSAPLEPFTIFDEKIEKRTNDRNTLNNFEEKDERKIDLLQRRKQKNEKEVWKLKKVIHENKSFFTYAFLATTSLCVILSVTAIVLIVIQISTGVACVLRIAKVFWTSLFWENTTEHCSFLKKVVETLCKKR